MRRQTLDGGAISAVPGRGLPRLDPLALPVRFAAPDAAADGRVRLVEIDRHRVLLSRSVRGMAIRVRLPLTAFRGIAARAVTAPAGEGATIVLTLEHADAALSVDLFAAEDDAEAVAAWELWGRVLGLPLLAADASGDCRTLGRTEAPAPRRRRRNAIHLRRPRLPLRRKPGAWPGSPVVYREREIIARN